MQRCNACRELVGKPSSVAPHGDLAASGVCAIGPTSHMTKNQPQLELHGLRKLAVPEYS
jgi:hypothetical protein